MLTGNGEKSIEPIVSSAWTLKEELCKLKKVY